MRLKKTLIVVSAAVALAFSTSPVFAGCDYTVAQLANQVPFSLQTAKIIKQTAVANNICSVIIQAKNPNGQEQLVPLFTIGNNAEQGIIVGTLFQNKQNITGNVLMDMQQETSKASFDAVKAQLPEVVVATYKPAKANGKILYAFTDPLCPFCHMAEKQLIQFADKSGYTIKIIPFLVHGQQSYDKIASFICSKLSFKDYINGNYGDAKVCTKAKDLLAKAQSIDSKLQLTGTPVFFRDDGKMVVGANLTALKQILDIQ